MTAAPLPSDEVARLETPRSYDMLDDVQERSLDALCRLAAKLLDVPIVLVSLIDRDRQVFSVNLGLDVRETPRDQAFCAHAILQDDVMVVEDAAADGRFADNPLVIGDPRIRFYAGAPLRAPDGHALGTFCAIDRQPRQFSEAQRLALADLGRTVMTVIEMRRSLQQMRALAVTDGLTGLANRSGFLAETGRAIAIARRHGEAFGLLMFDCDHFKAVNDRHGHAEGDALLHFLGQSLAQAVRTEDVAARLGGDEFAVLLHGCGEAETRFAGARLFATLRDGLATRPWPVSISLGGVGFTTAPADAAAALASVDRAMYDAKETGRDRAVFHAGAA